MVIRHADGCSVVVLVLVLTAPLCDFEEYNVAHFTFVLVVEWTTVLSRFVAMAAGRATRAMPKCKRRIKNNRRRIYKN